jgi:hypothetical protein
MRRLTVPIVAGMVVSVGFAAALAIWHDATIRMVGVEAYKVLLQFILVAVLGGGVSLLYQAFNREAERRADRIRDAEQRAEAAREIRRRYLRELIASYNAVKRTRRLLRATALTHAPSFADRRLRVARYDEMMQNVLDAQLTLETMTRTMRAEGSIFASEPNLNTLLGTAEAYLRSLIAEYETVMPQINQPEVEVGRLPKIVDFIGPYDESDRFRHEFVDAVQRSMATLEQGLGWTQRNDHQPA